MQEYGPNFDAEVLQNKKRLDQCDLICMIYDSADANSFAYVANLRVSVNLITGKISTRSFASCIHRHKI
jgi:mitochondrial Rho GTPase 1